jgi:hypothetical protein
MSKKAKTASRERRKREKRARKEANRARYAAMRDAGQNKKKKGGDQEGRELLRIKRHPNGECGNLGCLRCSALAQELAARRNALRKE